MTEFKTLVCAALAIFTLGTGAYDYNRDFDPTEQDTWPVIAVIIDDIGNRRADGERTVALPGPVACAVLPHTPFGPELAEAAYKSGKEVMLHQPLQATDSNHLLGTGAIVLDQSFEEVRDTLLQNLATVPHVSGINNHMGSLLTRHPGHMRWLMHSISQYGPLFFVDSVTSGQSVAHRVAKEHGLPSLKRDVFLDSVQTREAVAKQFDRLKQHARRHGFAVGIGHPFAETLDVLEQELPRLSGLGYRLVSIRSMIDLQIEQAAAVKQTRVSVNNERAGQSTNKTIFKESP
ncbi:MAG: divergent polysaccharide deacetylase family protein [Gammaproteobacteria bacterium]